ncbi:MAG: DUF1512 domain-containing protein [Nitrososphaerota archaeon]|nr:DUF1512 domain-containing protein [Candidatus Bathyarchaeota archaeon]MDW8048909.1 DUF1512 domain-containing protein [Nitrososphaerota archaeon]
MMAEVVLQLMQGMASQDNIGLLIQVAWLAFFVFYLLYGQKLQVKVMLKEVESSLYRLKAMRDQGRSIAISTIKEVGNLSEDPSARVDRILDHVYIPPVDLDPSGIIRRLEHIIDVRDFRFKDEVRHMVPNADETQINNLTNMLEAALALNEIYKYVRHFYLLGKKTSSFYIVLQLQMILPQIMKECEAFASALRAFTLGQPIGDGIGALVSAKLMYGRASREIAEDIVVSEVPIEGRVAYVLKAKGPGGNVGKPGEAVKQILEEREGRVALIILVDAAQKLEGEKPGEIVEGTGVAIGGPGVDKYKVEEAATKYKVPVHAILVKEGIGDVVSTMRKEISNSADEVIKRIHRIVLENTKPGDCLIIAGIGNTMGIAQ